MTTWTSTVGDPLPPQGGEVTPTLLSGTVAVRASQNAGRFMNFTVGNG